MPISVVIGCGPGCLDDRRRQEDAKMMYAAFVEFTDAFSLA